MLFTEEHAHLRESVQPEIDQFMRKYPGKIAHHVVPFADLVGDFMNVYRLHLDDLFEMVKQDDLSLFSKWHRQFSSLIPVTKNQHYDTHGWQKPKGEETEEVTL